MVIEIMKKEYKITIRSILKECSLSICLMLFVLYLLYSSHKSGFGLLESRLIPVLYTFIMLAAGLFPVIVYGNHYLYDKSTVLIIDTGSGEFIYKNGASSQREKIENIRLVKIYRCSMKGFRMLHYSEVFLSDNRQIIVGSLVEPSWLKYLNHARIVEERIRNILI
jgi:hypothetical protein